MIKVGVLRGGPSSEYEVSLKTGESVLTNLARQQAGLSEKYAGKDIVISRQGDWFFEGNFSSPERIFRSIDVVFNALHGAFGEDGKVQQILETFRVPYTGSAALASAAGMNKILAREMFTKAGLLVPRAITVSVEQPALESARRVLRMIGPSWVVKPSSSCSSVGISIAHNFHDLVRAIKKAMFRGSTSKHKKIIVEEYIKGREATCGIIDNFREREHYALPVIEIIPPENSDFFDYGAKYGGRTRELCPSGFDQSIKATIEDMARKAHQALGCRHYSRADFIVSPKGVYILEVNTLPGLTGESLFPKAISAIGSSYPEFLDHLLTLAIR